jgi:hypothetical protein
MAPRSHRHPSIPADLRYLRRALIKPKLAAEIAAQPTAPELSSKIPDYLRWFLRCPWCRRIAAGPFLFDASARLARHALESHPFELRFLELMVGAEWAREAAA